MVKVIETIYAHNYELKDLRTKLSHHCDNKASIYLNQSCGSQTVYMGCGPTSDDSITRLKNTRKIEVGRGSRKLQIITTNSFFIM